MSRGHTWAAPQGSWGEPQFTVLLAMYTLQTLALPRLFHVV